MTTQPNPKRWRPRFSVRTLVILVTLVCCYAACWGPTKTRGVKDVVEQVNGPQYDANSPVDDETLLGASIVRPVGLNTSTTIPLVVGIDENYRGGVSRHYYFWFFGYVAKLPFERELLPQAPGMVPYDPLKRSRAGR